MKVGFKDSTCVLVRDFAALGGWSWVANPAFGDGENFRSEDEARRAFIASGAGALESCVLIEPSREGKR